MKKIFLISGLILNLIFPTAAFCQDAPLTGKVEEENHIQFDKTNKVVDNKTGQAIPGASVSIPAKGIFTKTDGEGNFNLHANLSAPAIMAVTADGYKPFSLTITEEKTRAPLVISITKETGNEIIIDSALHHLGDGVYSAQSANADDFKTKYSGPYFSKKFYVDNIDKNSSAVLKIGSIIGLDTLMARKLGQGSIQDTFSSPTTIYLNSQKIGELKINGDGQKIIIPVQLLIPRAFNQIIIKTGQNMFVSSKIDYDDMEFMNLILEFK
jgi:hypothetical protein